MRLTTLTTLCLLGCNKNTPLETPAAPEPGNTFHCESISRSIAEEYAAQIQEVIQTYPTRCEGAFIQTTTSIPRTKLERATDVILEIQVPDSKCITRIHFDAPRYLLQTEAFCYPPTVEIVPDYRKGSTTLQGLGAVCKTRD